MLRPLLYRTVLSHALIVCFLHGQTTIDLKTQSKSVDFSAASFTVPFKTAVTLPSGCRIGEMVFKTSAPAGKNLYACTSANTWSILDAANATSQVTSEFPDFKPTITGNTVTVASGNAGFGN